MRLFAWIITKIFNPLSSSLATLVVVIYALNIPFAQKLFWLVVGFVISVIPAIILFLQYKKGKLSSFWSPTGVERKESFLAWAASTLLFAASVFWLGGPRLLLALSIVLFVLGFVNLILSPVFKISIHGELITLFVLLAILVVSVNLVFLAGLILLVAWARIYLKAHTLTQITSGIILSIVAVYVVFSLFGLATF